MSKTITHLLLVSLLTVFITSCQYDELSIIPNNSPQELQGFGDAPSDQGLRTKKDNSGKGKGKKDNDTDTTSTDTEVKYAKTYRIKQDIKVTDPLYKFHISESGDLILLESDSTIAMWGADFWGSWKDPFTYGNNKVNYINGLSNITYEFFPQSDGTISVKLTVITQPYPSGEPRTTVSYPGVYEEI